MFKEKIAPMIKEMVEEIRKISVMIILESILNNIFQM